MSDTRDQRDDCDVLVVGFGGAGACAAIEAHDAGARVVIVERFDGGGATSAAAGWSTSEGARPRRGAQAGTTLWRPCTATCARRPRTP
ncbi:MAG: FAD-dependent oxidoreductase [Sandaracinaceae bacterium]|nr:FAD-dependent oxidoreductase [Sandaracinaceae bacterium]